MRPSICLFQFQTSTAFTLPRRAWLKVVGRTYLAFALAIYILQLHHFCIRHALCHIGLCIGLHSSQSNLARIETIDMVDFAISVLAISTSYLHGRSYPMFAHGLTASTPVSCSCSEEKAQDWKHTHTDTPEPPLNKPPYLQAHPCAAQKEHSTVRTTYRYWNLQGSERSRNRKDPKGKPGLVRPCSPTSATGRKTNSGESVMNPTVQRCCSTPVPLWERFRLLRTSHPCSVQRAACSVQRAVPAGSSLDCILHTSIVLLLPNHEARVRLPCLVLSCLVLFCRGA